MVLVGSKTNKVLAYKVYSRQCTLCHRYGDKGHEGPCNSNYNGSAKSMEAAGMVHCLKEVESRGVKVKELIVDNDGNTMEAVQVCDPQKLSFLSFIIIILSRVAFESVVSISQFKPLCVLQAAGFHSFLLGNCRFIVI